MQPALRMHQVSKSFGPHAAVQSLSFEASPGECLGILGPNGAGKTTTLRMALGLTQPDAGSIHLLGFDMRQQGQEARRRVGVVPQSDALDPDFTVRENLEVFARYHDLDPKRIRTTIDHLLQFASLEKRGGDRVPTLSGGLKRRLTLARALINDPDLIFLDEPTTALDPQARHLIWERLQHLREQGKTLVLTTHFMDEAQRLCDRIMVVDQGQCIAQGTPRDMIRTHIGTEVIEVFGRLALPWVNARKSTLPPARIESTGETVFVYAPQVRAWMQALEDTEAAHKPEYLYRPANLEDVFLRLTGRDLRDN